MSILIRGMEMPNICAYCFIESSECNLHESVNIWKERHPDCPLIELPPHGRLIDADNLINLVTNATILGDNFKYAFVAIVNGEPTVIEAEGGDVGQAPEDLG